MKRLLLMIVATMLGASTAYAAGPVPIRVGWIVPVSNLVSIMRAVPGLAQNEGKAYKLDLIHFRGSTPQINALATGELDVAMLGFTSLPLAVQNAHLSDLRIIVDELRDGAPGYASGAYFVRNDSGVKAVADLKGKVLATNSFGGAVDIAMRIELLKNHIDPRTDVNVIEAPFPTMPSMLLSGKAALVPAVPPFSEDPGLNAKGHVLFTQRDGMGGPSELVIWVARQGFLAKHHDAVVAFLADYLRALHFYTDPKNHGAAVKIASDFTKLPPRAFDSWLFTHKDSFRPRDGVPDTAVLQNNIDVMHRYGFLKERIDIARYVDPGLIREAAKTLTNRSE